MFRKGGNVFGGLLHGVYAMRQGASKTDAALAYGFDIYAGFYKAFCREF